MQHKKALDFGGKAVYNGNEGRRCIMGREDILRDEDRPIYALDLAFMRFSTHRFPVLAELRRYTSMTMMCGHRHDFAQVWYCVDGQCTHQVKDQSYRCAKGSVILVPPGTFHGFRLSEGESVELIRLDVIYDIFMDIPERYFNAEANLFLPPFEKELGFSFPSYVMLSRESQAVFEEQISWFASLSFSEPGKNWREQIYDRLEALFSVPELSLSEEYREKAVHLLQTRVSPMVRVLHHLNLQYSEKINEETLLQISAVSHTNLYRYFKQFVSYTYGEYLQRLRARHVYCYLFHTTYPMTYISDRCGFYDTQHMSLVFKKYMGIAPRKFRMIKRKWLAENPDYKSNLPKG